MTKEAKIYQLKITLKYIRPPVWRRIQVRRNITLAALHQVLQITMGWYDSHLHQFRAGKTYYGAPDIDEFCELNLKDDSKAQLGRVLTTPKQKLIYEYDFGDGWEHEILLEKVLTPDPTVQYPRCLGGARACPPEDCGGAGGYGNFLAAIRDPNHEEHDEYLDWIGGEFDPEEFELDEVDAGLRHVTMDEQNIAAGLLVKAMSGISEEYWCAGWLHNLEYTLWDAVTGRRKDLCSPEEIEQLKYLSEKCGGWIIWDEQALGEKFIPMRDWLRLYEAHRLKTSERNE